MAGEKLARLIKEGQVNEKELSDLVYGVVTQVSPLAVRVDSRFVLEGNQHFILSQMVRNLTLPVTVSVNVEDQIKYGSGTVQVFRGLQTGDRVRMLRISKGQKYYILDRG